MKKNFLCVRTARIILDDDFLRKALRDKNFSYLTALSYNSSFSGKGITVKTKKTPVIVLADRSQEQVFSEFNDTTRNEIRKTEKNDSFLFNLPDNNTDIIYRLYNKFEKTGGRLPRKKDYFRNSIFGSAYVGGEIIAAIIAYDSFPFLRINAIVSNKIVADKRMISNATRRIIWEFVKYGLNRKYQWLDLGGVNLKDPTKAGITSFKMSFGGVLIDEFTYTYKGNLYKLLKYVERFLY